MKKAVEMPGHGRGGKPKAGFPPRPQPLEIAKGGRFPHSHRPDDEAGWKTGNPKAGFPLSHRLDDLYIETKKGGLAADRFAPAFRLILHENQIRASGSSFDENMLLLATLVME